MSELSQFEALLSQLMAGDNNIRNHAEKVYNQMQEEKPDQALALLIQAASSSQNTQVSIIVLLYVLFRARIHITIELRDGWEKEPKF
jgi:protoheme ferro-lyase